MLVVKGPGNGNPIVRTHILDVPHLRTASQPQQYGHLGSDEGLFRGTVIVVLPPPRLYPLDVRSICPVVTTKDVSGLLWSRTTSLWSPGKRFSALPVCGHWEDSDPITSDMSLPAVSSVE